MRKSEIMAGKNIRDIYYFGQNVRETDRTVIEAGNNIFFSSLPGSSFNTGIEHGGPGHLIVQAGNSIDLGTTRGIQTVGSAFNPSLNPKGSSVIVASGFSLVPNPVDVGSFFDGIRDAGVEYSGLLEKGELDQAQVSVEKARTDIIAPFLSSKSQLSIVCPSTSG